MLKILKFQCFSFGKKKKRMLKKGVADVAIFLVPFYDMEWVMVKRGKLPTEPTNLSRCNFLSLSLSLSNYRFHGIIIPTFPFTVLAKCISSSHSQSPFSIEITTVRLHYNSGSNSLEHSPWHCIGCCIIEKTLHFN